MNPPEALVSFVCEECGEPIVVPARRCGRTETCPHCGAFVDVPGRGDPRLSVAPATEPPAGEMVAANRSWLWFEVAAVVCLAVLPDFVDAVNSYWYLVYIPFANAQLHLIVRALRVCLPLLAIMALTSGGWRQFGIVRPRWLLDLGLGCLIWGVATIASSMAMTIATHIEVLAALKPSATVWPRPAGAMEYCLLFVGSFANGCAEQLALQGYLLTRLERLLGSTAVAVLVTTLLFASYHIYQGSVAVLGIAAIGIVNATAFCFIRRLWPLCVAHAIADVIGWTAG